jgi:hypothetical protein
MTYELLTNYEFVTGARRIESLIGESVDGHLRVLVCQEVEIPVQRVARGIHNCSMDFVSEVRVDN